MRHKVRSEVIGVVSRKLASDLLVMNLYGKNVHNMVVCACGVPKLKSEFYLESSSKRKYGNQTRLQCVECWDKHHGKKPKRSYDPSNTLENFFDEKESSNA